MNIKYERIDETTDSGCRNVANIIVEILDKFNKVISKNKKWEYQRSVEKR